MQSIQKRECRQTLLTVLIVALVLLVIGFIMFYPDKVYAASLWDKVDKTLKDIYSQIFKLSSIIAGLAAIIALLIYMISKSPRAVDEAKSWLKRIVIAWLIINGIGYFVSYGKDLFSDVATGVDVFK